MSAHPNLEQTRIKLGLEQVGLTPTDSPRTDAIAQAYDKRPARANETQYLMQALGLSMELERALSAALANLANTKAALANRTEQANDHEHECIRLRAELTTAQQGHARYEYVRRLNPRQYAELWTKPWFDQAIDAAMKAEGGKANT